MRGWCKIVITAMLIFMHWVIMAYSEKSDIIVLEKCEVYSTQKDNIVFIPPANFVCGGYTVFTLSVRLFVRPCVRPCVRP